jgi:hypothetical protein
MAGLGDWENIISQHINGAPQPVMMDAVRDAAIEFCRDTRVDRRLVTHLNYEAAKPDMLIPDGPNSEFPSGIVTVWTTEGKSDGLTRHAIDDLYPDGFVRVTVDAMKDVKGWISLRPGSLRLVPALSFDAPEAIDVEVAYQPKRNATEVAQFLYELWAYEIGWGALAILHAHHGAAYAEPSVSGMYRDRFNDAKHNAAERGYSGFGKVVRSVRREKGLR